MSNLLLQKIVLLRVTEVGKIILKKNGHYFWRGVYHHRLHWKLSFWQPPVRPVTKILEIVASVHERYGNTVTLNHPMPMLAVELVIATTRATVSDQRVATAPTSPNHRLFALSCCYKYSNRFHHSRNYINQSSNIWYGGKQSINYAS